MNKIYVFFASSICNMGGQEQYLKNKTRRLFAEGFEVYLFSFREGRVLLDELQQFKKYVNPVLRLEPYLYKATDVEKCLNWIEGVVKPCSGDNIYVESNVAPQAEWGELFAQRVGGRHIIIDLQEVHNYATGLKTFLKYKYGRRELFGITKKSISLILGSEYNDERAMSSFIHAECGGAIQEIEHPIVDKFRVKDINIGSLGRLDKSYVIPMIKDIVEFAKGHDNKSIGLLLIGGGSKEIVKTIQNEIAKSKNISLFITGFLYPIPGKLIKKIDCFICTAGSAYATMRYGVPTVVYSMSSYKPLGIFDYTIKDISVEDSEEHPDMQYLLQAVLLEHFCENHPPLGLRERKRDYQEEFYRQISFFNSDSDCQYYDVSKVIAHGIKVRLYKLISFVVGARLFEKIQRTLGMAKKNIY